MKAYNEKHSSTAEDYLNWIVTSSKYLNATTDQSESIIPDKQVPGCDFTTW